MGKRKIELSIIIVHYRAKRELFSCISSIEKLRTKTLYEVIVVDNDEKPVIEKELIQKFPNIIYVKNSINNGYGGGNNRGVMEANGKFLFFLNPDTILFPDIIDQLIGFIKERKDIGIVAPLLVDKNTKPFPLQGNTELTPIKGIFSLSFLKKLIPKNPVLEKFMLVHWDKKNTREVDVAPGTAMLLRKSIFEEAGKFDENLFLYFEEFDLCKRVKKLGYKIFIHTESRILHLWGKSAKQRNDTDEIFAKSRFYYFRKHFGLLSALIVNVICAIRLTTVVVISILVLGGFLRFYRLSEVMTFIGDQGWFYLSARDMLLSGTIPLVGISSSHSWLHQGPFWTYFLALALWVGNFNPISGAYLTASMGVITIWLFYRLGSILFNQRVGLMCAMLYATSPLVVMHARMAYHTSPIPLFVIFLILFMYKWIKGNVYFFPLAVFLLGVLYNFELATTVFIGVLFIFITYGAWTRKMWANILTKKMLIVTIIAGSIPMTPVLIYDTTHGFAQTLKFAAWIFYRAFTFFDKQTVSLESAQTLGSFLFLYNQRLVFITNGYVAFMVIIASFILVFFTALRFLKKKREGEGFLLVLLFIVASLIGIVVHQSPSEAYVPMLFPSIILIIALFINWLMEKKKLTFFSFFLFFFMVVMNSYALTNMYYATGKVDGHGSTFSEKIDAASNVIRLSNGKKYNLTGEGEGSEFESFTMNYEYLTWWLGHGPSKDKEKLIFIIKVDDYGTHVKKKQ